MSAIKGIRQIAERGGFRLYFSCGQQTTVIENQIIF